MQLTNKIKIETGAFPPEMFQIQSVEDQLLNALSELDHYCNPDF
jgi:hypothetical protein